MTKQSNLTVQRKTIYRNTHIVNSKSTKNVQNQINKNNVTKQSVQVINAI